MRSGWTWERGSWGSGGFREWGDFIGGGGSLPFALPGSLKTIDKRIGSHLNVLMLCMKEIHEHMRLLVLGSYNFGKLEW